METTNNSMPVKTTDSSIWGSSIFGGKPATKAKISDNLKLKATDKLINFNEFGYICEDAPLTRNINPKVVEASTLKDVDFSDCNTLSELCDKALKELVHNGADSDLAQVAIVGFMTWWGRKYHGLTPIINFTNTVLTTIELELRSYTWHKRPEQWGVKMGPTILDLRNHADSSLVSIVFSEHLEAEVSMTKHMFLNKLKRELSVYKDIEFIKYVNDLIEHI